METMYYLLAEYRSKGHWWQYLLAFDDEACATDCNEWSSRSTFDIY